jgi:hypothetical protein
MDSKRQWSIGAILLGFVLVAAAFIGRVGSRPRTPEQARAYNEAAADLYRLHYEAAAAREASSHPDSARSGQSSLAEKKLGAAADAGLPIDPSTATVERTARELAAAQQRYAELRAELERARAHAGSPVAALLWPGIGLIALGACGLLSARSRGPEDVEG